VISPTTVASFQASFRSMPFKNTPTDGSAAFPIKINGLDPQPPFAGPPAILVGNNALSIGSPDTGSPAGSFSGLFDRLLFNYQADYDYAFDPTITKIVAGHTLKAGFHFRRDYTTQELAGRPYGRYTTASDFNNAGSTVSATGDAFADFLLGYPSTTDVSIGKPGGWESGTTYGAFLQDSWKVNARLTLDLGLRYDSFGFFEEMNKRASIADFKTGKILIPHGGSANILPEFAPFADQFLEADKAGLPNTFVHPNRLNFSPRLGFAYRVNNGLVVRGAFGIYTVDTVGYINFDQVNNPPIVLRSQLSRNLLLSRGVDVNSLYTFQNPTAGLATAAANTLLSSMVGYTADYPAQRTYTWNFTVEKDLGHQMGGRISYVGNVGRNIPRTVEVNACPPGVTVCLSRPAGDPTARALTQYDVNIGSHTADGRSDYHSVEMDLNRRFSNGLLLDVNYTWSKLLALATIATNPAVAPQSSYDYGPAPFAPPKILHFNYVYELPFGKGRPFGSRMPGAAEAVLGGWTISGLCTWQSGYGLTPTAPGQSPTGATANRANRIADGRLDHSGSRSQNAARWFDPSAFQVPAFVNAGAPQPVRQFGSSAIGVIPGPSFFNYDMSVSKQFAIREKSRIIVRGEILNPLNIPMLGIPDLDSSSATFGLIRLSNSDYNPRSVQASLRFEF
jgi:hypothetical protein